MIIVSYDISSNKKRAKFSKFLEKYGERVQYSVFRIKNSVRILNIIQSEIEHTFMLKFDFTDSVYIFRTCESCSRKIIKYGSALHEDSNVIIFE
jgi:CRISPR-associated protein Cas2